VTSPTATARCACAPPFFNSSISVRLICPRVIVAHCRVVRAFMVTTLLTRTSTSSTPPLASFPWPTAGPTPTVCTPP
jgi:hypothetical protein